MESTWADPIDQRAFYVLELHNRAATRIQVAWRKYKSHKLCTAVGFTAEHKRAAVVIQKAVRQWLEERRKEMSCQQPLMLEGVSEERQAQLQREIRMWQNAHCENKAESLKQVEENHAEVQRRLTSWYMKTGARRRRDQHLEAKCAQLGAALVLLKSSPALADYQSADMDFYQCLALPHATEARLKHKQQLRAISAPWWEKLELQDNY